MQNSTYLEFAQGLAREAGSVMKNNFSLGMEREWKEDHSPLTVTDQQIHNLVASSLNKSFPDHVLWSEEGGATTISKEEYVWICDPVDGTHNFSSGIPTATFMLSLLKDGQVLLGIIYDPFLDRMFYAEKGQGAFMNGKKISVSKATQARHTCMGMGKMTGVLLLIPVFDALRKDRVIFVTGLSIGYMGALVGAGEFTVTFFGGTDPHDMVAIKIIVEEAGGKVTDLFGNVTRADEPVRGQLASNGLFHDELLDIIKKYGTE